MALEDKVNEILGLEPAKTPTEKKEFQPPVPRKEDKNNPDIDNAHKYSRCCKRRTTSKSI